MVKLTNVENAARVFAFASSFLVLGCGMPQQMEAMNGNTARMADQLEKAQLATMNQNTARLADQVEQDQKYLKAVSEDIQGVRAGMKSIQRIADSAEHFQAMADSFAEVLKPTNGPLFQPAPAPQPQAAPPAPAPADKEVTADEFFGPADPAAPGTQPSQSPSPPPSSTPLQSE